MASKVMELHLKTAFGGVAWVPSSAFCYTKRCFKWGVSVPSSGEPPTGSLSAGPAIWWLSAGRGAGDPLSRYTVAPCHFYLQFLPLWEKGNLGPEFTKLLPRL